MSTSNPYRDNAEGINSDSDNLSEGKMIKKTKFIELENTIKGLQELRKRAEDLLKANITHEDFDELVNYYNEIYYPYTHGISTGAEILEVYVDYNCSIGNFPDYLKKIFPGISKGKLLVDGDKDDLVWLFNIPKEFQDYVQ